MAERSIVKAFVEIVTKGMNTVQATIDKIKASLTGVEKPREAKVKVDAQGADKVSSLKDKLDNLPPTKKVEAKVEGADQVANLKDKLDKLPATKKVEAKVEGADKVASLKDKLDKLPASKTVEVTTKETRLAAPGAAPVAAPGAAPGGKPPELPAPKVPAPSSFNLAGVVSGALGALGKLQDSITQIGRVATGVFVGGALSIAGFVRAADPAGFLKLQGTLAALAVQIGSIFIPILRSVQKTLEGLLGWFRSLSNEQKDNILQWVKIGAAVLATVAILPKLVAGFSAVGAALEFVGLAEAEATAGISVLLGLIAAAVGGLVILGLTAKNSGEELEQSTGGFKGIFDSLSKLASQVAAALAPVVAHFQSFGEKLLTVFGGALAKLLPVASAVFGTLGQAIGTLVKGAKPIVDAFISILGSMGRIVVGIFTAMAPVVQTTVKIITAVISNMQSVFGAWYTAIAQIWKALEPIVTRFAKVWFGEINSLLKVVQAWYEGMKPIFDAVGELIGNLGDIFSSVIDVIGDLLGDLLGSSMDFSATWEGIGNTIKDVLKSLVPVVKAVFGVIQSEIMVLSKLFVYLGSLMKSVRDGNLKGAISRAEADVKAFENRVAQKKKEREDAAKETEKENKTPKAPAEHAGQTQQKVDISSFAEVWRKAQQATGESPEMRQNREIHETQKQSLEQQKKIAANTDAMKDKKPAAATFQ